MNKRYVVVVLEIDPGINGLKFKVYGPFVKRSKAMEYKREVLDGYGTVQDLILAPTEAVGY